jgi:hypothetical protein
MSRLSRTFIWLLLVPYFAVASINAPAWIGETKRDTNRGNALVVISLIFAFTALGALSLAGAFHRLDGVSPYWIGLATVVPPMIALSLWLNREREKRYSALYKSMPIWERVAFGLTTLAFTSLMIWLFFRKHA